MRKRIRLRNIRFPKAASALIETKETYVSNIGKVVSGKMMVLMQRKGERFRSVFDLIQSSFRCNLHRHYAALIQMQI